MEKFIKENGIAISILISWMFINFIFFLLEEFQIVEFVFFGFSPLIVFIIIKLISYDKK